MIASIVRHADHVPEGEAPQRAFSTARAPRPMVARALAVACLTAALAGCYSPNQKAFEKEVHTLVQPGMPVSAAVAQLTQRGFNCTGEPITCSRIRQRLLPSSCVERVNLEATGQSSSALLSVEIRPIVCAGL
jgi:hypothetical protein